MDLEKFFALIILIYWIVYRLPTIVRKKLQTHVVKRKRLNIIGELPLLISLIFYGYLAYTLIKHPVNENPPLIVLAIGLFLSSAIFNEWARVILGKQWSGSARIVEEHRLIKKGAYSIVRHPMYLANLLMMISGLLVARSLLIMFLFLTNFSILIYRIRIEEEELIKEFGKEYKDYQKEVKKLIPLVF